MAERKVLKGVFREGSLVASVIQEGDTASIMLKGADPNMPRDPAFTESLKRTAAACFEHISPFVNRELCAILVQRPSQAEFVDVSPDDIRTMGLSLIKILDPDSGLTVRVCDTNPPATTLSYDSLKMGSGTMPSQPGRIEIQPGLPRKLYKDLTESQKQLYAAAVQVAGVGLYKLVCLEDEGNLRMVVTLKDLPPARARSVIVPLGDLAAEIDAGAKIEDVGKKLEPIRAG